MWPKEVREIQYHCSADDSFQQALVYGNTETKKARPLLVGLHTWSFDYKQAEGETVYAKWCMQNGWHFIHPDFRGANNNPKAMGSDYVVSDIIDSVKYMKEHYPVDTERIYCVGVSGGGHAALLMAGRAPDVWAGVSAWCGISDIKEWYKQTAALYPHYAQSITKACGGNPLNDENAILECMKRSPVSYLSNAELVNLDINAGVKDGHEGPVPFTQSLSAFNSVASTKDSIKALDMQIFYDSNVIPPWGTQDVTKELYSANFPLFVKTSGNARVVIFNGGHEIVHMAALNWLAIQRRGQKAQWFVDKPVEIEVSKNDMKSGL